MSTSIAGTSSANASQGLGVTLDTASELQTDFLELLITQMQNQDPFSPMDSSAMTQQLATLSQLEQLEGINSRLDESMLYYQSLQNTMMMDLVGKRVTVSGDGVEISGGEPSRSLVRTVSAGTAHVEIRDAGGNLVRSIDDVPIDAGFTAIEWDGKSNTGETLADGSYTMSVSVTDADGKFVSAAIFQSGVVETIQFDNNFQTLIVNGQEYAPGDVVEVGVPVASENDGANGDDGDTTGEDDG